MPALPSWLADPLWDQFAALLPPRPTYVATHPWGCHRRRIGDRIVVTVAKLENGQVRLGIEAPREIAVFREEIDPRLHPLVPQVV